MLSDGANAKFRTLFFACKSKKEKTFSLWKFVTKGLWQHSSKTQRRFDILMKKWFCNLKLQWKFFVILLSSLLVVFVGAMTTTRMTEQAYTNALYERTMQMLMLFSQSVQAELDDVAEVSFSVLADNVLQDKLSEAARNQNDSGIRMTTRDEINKRLVNISLLGSNVTSLRLRAHDGTFFTRSMTGDTIPTELFDHNEQTVYAASGSPVWIPDQTAPGAIFLLRDIREVKDLTLNSIAMLGMRVSMERLVGTCVEPLLQMNMPLMCAIDFKGARVYASNERLMSLNGELDDYSLQTLNGEVYFCAVHKPASSEWSYIAALPYDEILHSLHRASAMATSIAAGALALALVLAWLLIASIVRHFKRLLSKYERFANGEPQLADEIALYRERGDEIGELHRQFDRMETEHRRMVEEIYVKQQLLLEAQLRQLRAQIRPHFLYNTLESISCLAERCDDQRIATMSIALGHMLRASLNDKRDMIQLRDDIAIAEEYLSIQRIRYQDQLSAEFLVEDEYLDVMIPAMTLQPLVENAVAHGAEEMLEVCEIRIFAEPAGRYIDIIVEDNGPGMDEDILEKLASGEMKADGLGIGMSNIHQRLKLAFQDDGCGLRVQRVDGKTQVIVRILAEVKGNG